jgi:hypothetical protein
VLSLVAAYTGRNLIFEQRIAGNQFQATTSFDAAEAGLDWAISQLNGSRIDNACVTTADLTRDKFRDRYLAIDPASGVVTPRTDAGAILWAACVFNGADWACNCPATGAPSLTAPVGTGSFPAFAVRFEADTVRPGVVRVEVNGCARYDPAHLDECLTMIRGAGGNPSDDCDSTMCALLALNSSLRHLPVAALTARVDVQAGTGPLTVVNADPSSAITARAGGTIDPAHTMVSAPGTPGDLSKVWNDSGLQALVADSDTCTNCLFAATFGLARASYRRKQDVVEVDCTATCTASGVRVAAGLHPGRTLWLKGAGGLDFDDNTAVGSLADPITLIVEGPVLASAAAPRFFGVLYASTVSLGSGSGEWRGVVLSSGNVTNTGAATVAFDKPLLDTLRFRQGSFVRVPGSWRDYQ